MDNVSRVSLLVWQLRDRVKEMTNLQRRIRYDMEVIIEDGDGVRNKYVESRQQYLNLLGISVAELRKTMSESDMVIPTYDFDVEDIMKRVRPVTEVYLQKLVNAGAITESDMECMLVGGYDHIDDFYRDLRDNTGIFGLLEATESSTSASSQEQGASQSDQYDDNGFFVLDERDKDDANGATRSEPVESESSTISAPVVRLPPSESFSWADEVEEEIRALETVKPIDQDSLAAPPLPTEEHSPVDLSFPSDSSDAGSDASSDVSSDFEYDVSHSEMVSSMSEAQLSDSEEKQENEDAELPTLMPATEAADEPKQEVEQEVEQELAQEVAQKMEEDGEEELDISMSNPETANETEQPIPPNFATYRSLSEQSDGDEVLDEWLEEQEMWFWQYEALFLITLAAKRFKGLFEEARAAYKADPFYDID